DDPDLRRAVGEQYRQTTQPVVAQILAAKQESGDEAGARISSSILSLAEHMGEVPVIVLPCYDIEAAASRYGGWIGPSAAPSEMGAGGYASLYSPGWSF